MGLPHVKDAVRRYFDAEVAGYLGAYEDAPSDDARHDAFSERRDLVLAMTPSSAHRVLDIGAGPGVFTRPLLDRGAACWVVDLSYAMVAAASREVGATTHAGFMVGDIDRLPFSDASFDAALCVGVLQYLPSLDSALRELARVTRPRGHVIVTFPNERSPLNTLHRAAIAVARVVRGVFERSGLVPAADPSRLTFRSDIPNRGFAVEDIDRRAGASGLAVEEATFHVLQFPFAIPGLGPAVRQWNRFVRGRFPRGRYAAWGREVVMRLQRLP